MIDGLLRASKAAGILAAAAILTLTVSALADGAALVGLYAVRFSFLPGPWFGERMAASRSDSASTCLFIGASTVREAFDPRILASHVPGTRFLNAGTTGGNNEVFEIEAQIIARYGFHYRCIVLGVNPWVMFSTPATELVSTNYVSQLRISDVARLSTAPWRGSEAFAIAFTYALPFAKHAEQFNRLARVGAYRLHRQFVDRRTPIALYEHFDGELRQVSDFAYPPTARYLQDDRENVARGVKRFEKRELYGHPEQSASLRRALALLATESDALYVVTLPDTALIAQPNAWAEPTYDADLRAIGERMTAIDCRGGMVESNFLDFTHVNARGRQILSDAVGTILAEHLAGSTKHMVSGPCRM